MPVNERGGCAGSSGSDSTSGGGSSSCRVSGKNELYVR